MLVDQDKCRGWRMCVSGCPYKKIYFNHRTGKAEKCTFCFPRIEVGMPTVCSETCVGRLRYIGVVLYDADAVLDAAAAPDEQDLYEAQLAVFLDPDDPQVQAAAAEQGIPEDWMEAARRSPVYQLAVRHQVALPLHPEYRTMPMVWYIPPLSPVSDIVHAEATTMQNPITCSRDRRAAHPGRVPGQPVHRRQGRARAAGATQAGGGPRHPTRRTARSGPQREADRNGERQPGRSGRLYRLLAIAKYDDRYVIPKAHAEDAGALMGQHEQLFCSLDTDGGPGMGGNGPPGPHGVQSWRPDGRTQLPVLGQDD